MATQPHDVGLVWIHKRANFVGEQDSTFLTLSPAWAVFMKQVEQEVLVPQDEGVAGDVLPTKVHGRVFHEAIPGVIDVLTDVVEQCFHSGRSHMCRMDEDIVNRAISSRQPKPGSSLQDVMSMWSCPTSDKTGRT